MNVKTLRATSVYEISTPGAAPRLELMLNRLREKLGVEIAGSGIDPSTLSVFVRIRVKNDDEAISTALALLSGRSFSIATGYGINRRELNVGRLDSTEEPVWIVV